MSVAVRAKVENVKVFFAPMYSCVIYAGKCGYYSGACDTKEEALQTAIHKIIKYYPK